MKEIITLNRNLGRAFDNYNCLDSVSKNKGDKVYVHFSWNGKGRYLTEGDKLIREYDQTTGKETWTYQLADRNLNFVTYINTIARMDDSEVGEFVYEMRGMRHSPLTTAVELMDWVRKNASVRKRMAAKRCYGNYCTYCNAHGIHKEPQL